MKAAVWYGNKDIRVEDRPIEKPGPDEVQIKVMAAGICGTDIHEWWAGPIFMPVDEPHPLTGKTAPLTGGHEFSGVISAVGSEVKDFKIGDRVTSDSATWCGKCESCKKGWYSLCEKVAYLGLCRNGAFAEFVTIPAEPVVKLPDNVSFEWGALVEPFAVAVHAHRRARTQVCESIVIIGAGTIGLMAIHVAKIAGAGKIFAVEVSEKRKAAASALGAIVLDPSKDDVKAAVLSQTENRGADIVMEVVGKQDTVDLALSLPCTRGRVVILGIFEEPIQIDWNRIVFNELEVLGHMNNGGEFPQVLELMANGTLQVEQFITGRIGLSQIVEKGYEELNRDKSHIKILVDPSK
jgi:(R,R)-butanediol dehydrogenase / meso-butanediol dehydrogenase / diacetyl reductase